MNLAIFTDYLSVCFQMGHRTASLTSKTHLQKMYNCYKIKRIDRKFIFIIEFNECFIE